MKEIILEKSKNLGALNSFLKNPKNIMYYNYIIDNIPDYIKDEVLDFKELLWYYLNEINEIQRCICNKKLKYFEGKYRKTCGDKLCSKNSRKATCIEKYGVDNPNKSKVIQKKSKEIILEKYNGQHYMKNTEVVKKFKTTMMKNHGVEYAQQNKNIQKKSIETFNNNPNKEQIIKERNIKLKEICSSVKVKEKKNKTFIENYGSLENLNSNIQNKIKKTSLEKYGVEHFFMSQEVINKRINSYINTINNKIVSILEDNYIFINKEYNKNKTNNYLNIFCKTCNTEFKILRQLLFKRKERKEILCLNCNPIFNGTSLEQIELFNYIKNLIPDLEVLENIDTIISPKHLDIYIPNLKIAFEYNGIYWHSEEYKDKNYHLDKTNSCKNIGIDLIHIFSDDWIYKKDIVKSIIKNRLGLTDNKIFARKCNIRLVDSKICKEFLEKNHLQGNINSKINLGLYYKNDLVSLMTFGNLRIFMNQKSKKGHYELLRFCSLLNLNVIGGANKLFNYFKNNYYYEEIISYCNNSRSSGNLYNILGFSFSHISSPGYSYVKDDIRYSRFNWKNLIDNKDNKHEKEIMFENNFFRIYDCGMIKYVFNK
jgi:hypothetical protein